MGFLNSASFLKGIEIKLYQNALNGIDEFNRPIYKKVPVIVENVLVSPVNSSNIEVTTTTDLNGKKASYILGIPKGDNHDWKDKEVEFFGQKFRTIGIPQEGIESMIPLEWNKKVYCERYE